MSYSKSIIICIGIFIIPINYLTAQEPPFDQYSPDEFERTLAYTFADGVLTLVKESELAIYSCRQGIIEASFIEYPEGLDPKKIDNPGFAVHDETFYFYFYHDDPRFSYKFHVLKIKDQKLLDYNTYYMRYAFSSPNYYLLSDEQTVTSFMSGERAYITHYSLKNKYETYRTPRESFVQNPDGQSFGLDSKFDQQSRAAAYVIREAATKKYQVGVEDPYVKEANIFSIDIPDMFDSWSTRRMIVDTRGEKIFIFGIGFDGYDYQTRQKGDKKEALIVIDVKNKKTSNNRLDRFFWPGHRRPQHISIS